uniref:Uncharacterized protein n=1 Tax=Cannabis sativa TaxID=3483 RepID=A0A803NTE1_CANSA
MGGDASWSRHGRRGSRSGLGDADSDASKWGHTRRDENEIGLVWWVSAGGFHDRAESSLQGVSPILSVRQVDDSARCFMGYLQPMVATLYTDLAGIFLPRGSLLGQRDSWIMPRGRTPSAVQTLGKYFPLKVLVQTSIRMGTFDTCTGAGRHVGFTCLVP